MGKRERSGDPIWWPRLKEEIESNGGYVHPNVRFNENLRELHVDNSISGGKETIVLRIPNSSLISTRRAKQMLPWWNWNELQQNVHSPLSDILISLALASANTDSCLYLATLPKSSSFDTLPRRWSDDQLKKRLQGSPLFDHVKKSKLGVRGDYEFFKHLWGTTATGSSGEQSDSSTSSSFPSFEVYSDMLAVVSSRAFSIDDIINNDSTGEVALVPLLDLCNHCRGQGDNDNKKKNLSYAMEKNGDMVVRLAVDEIQAGENLRLTYGAQGNSQLLINYGFCIPNNLEPDGSSNDVLEFHVHNDQKDIVLLLRTGPKAYTFGCLTRAIDTYMEQSVPQQRNDEQDESTDDMEDFLNECENEPADSEIDIYGEGDASVDTDGERPSTSSTQRITHEAAALKKFLENIQTKLQGYEMPHDNNLTSKLPQALDSDRYARLLIQSEKRTLHFFARAVQKIMALLQDEKQLSSPKEMENDDIALVEAQTDELALAYQKVRLGNV